MQKYLFLFLFLFNAQYASAQSSEFKSYENGLIYSDTTIGQLRYIVDSLNLKHKVCDLNKKYYAKAQARGHFITIAHDDIKAALNDLKEKITYNELLTKYPKTKIDDNLAIVQFKYKNYDDKEVIKFSSLGFGGNYGNNIEVKKDIAYNKGDWIIDHSKKTKYSEESLSAFYLETELKTQLIPTKYARMLQYAECLVDTSTDIFLENAKRSGRGYFLEREKIKRPANKNLFKYFYEKSNKPNEKKYKKNNGYWQALRDWDSTKFVYADNNLAGNKEFLTLLSTAAKEALEKGGSTNELESLVGKYLSKEKELELKRNRIVVGGCSQDRSPRYHARDIAILAAETVKWEIFLRAHLNIMNDRFERASDGSYALGERNTYIRELEEINIDVPNLLFGILFRTSNPCANHYYGSVRRLGRAMSETKKPEQLEEMMLDMIQDNTLDDYNRVMMYYLIQNYNYNISDSIRQLKNVGRIQDAVQELPQHIKVRIESKHHQLERLLRKEVGLLKKHFTIKKSFIGSMSSIDWDGEECWSAHLKINNVKPNILISATMDNSNAPGSIKPLLKDKDEMVKRIMAIPFLMDHLKENKNRSIEINYVTNQSFSKKAQESFTEDLPKAFDTTLLVMNSKAIFFDLSNEFGNSRWLVYPNKQPLLWHYEGESPIKKYTDKDLKTSGEYFKYVYKFFDNKGNLIN